MLEELIQGSPEWLKFRKTKITATDAPAIMRANPDETPYKRWRRKLDLDPPQYTTEAMRRGIELEPIARKEACKIFDIEFNPAIKISRENDWAMASLDGISHDSKSLIEIKCPISPKERNVPARYMPQLQHQMYVCEVESMIYFNYFPGDIFYLTVYRDDSYIKNMLKEEQIFLECVNNLEPPKSPELEFVHRWDEPFCQAALHLKEISSQKKSLEKQEKEVREYLIQMADGHNSKAMGLTLTKVVSKGRMDYEKIIQDLLQGVDLEKYRKPNIESWRVA